MSDNILPEGKYIARMSGAVVKKSKSGNQYLLASFDVTQGPYTGHSAFRSFHFTDAALEYTVADLQKCGWADDDIAAFDGTDLRGCNTNEVRITVEHEPYTDQNGNERVAAKVKWINSLDSGLKSNVSEGERAAFGASMKGRIAALKAKAAASGARPLSQPTQGTARPVSTPQNAPRPSAQNTAQQPPRMQGAVAPGSFGDDDVPF